MAAKKKAAKAQKAALKARYNPYVQQVIDDEDLRDNLVQAYEAARDAYVRLSNGKSPTKQIFDDKKLQKDIKEASESIRDAAVKLRQARAVEERVHLGHPTVHEELDDALCFCRVVETVVQGGAGTGASAPG